MGANYYLDNRRAQYADTTQRLKAMDADIQKDTNSVVERTNTAKQVIAENNKTLTQLSLEKAMLDSTKLQLNKSCQQLMPIFLC